MIVFIIKVWLVILVPVIIVWLIVYLIAALFSRKRSKMEKEFEENGKVQEESGQELKENRNLKSTIIGMVSGLEKYLIFKTGYIPSHKIRNIIYRKIFRLQMEKTSKVRYGCVFKSPEKIGIGKGTIIGDNCNLDGRKGIYIGENVNFSSEVSIWTLQHETNSSKFDCTGGQVIINDRAWLSNRCIVLPGVTIAEGCIVAANAVVTKNTEPYSIYAGIPAKKIADRNRNLEYELKKDRESFFY